MQSEINAGADRIRAKSNIISAVRQAAGLTQEELADLLEVRQFYISQVEARENITLSTLISTIVAMGGSILQSIFQRSPRYNSHKSKRLVYRLNPIRQIDRNVKLIGM
jgi:DNA-binding XRE family transcriptional regulator